MSTRVRPALSQRANRPLAVLIFAWISWGLFCLTGLYLIGFLGNLVVPKGIDSGTVTHWLLALMINLELLALFGLQHSVMARPWFKRWLVRYLPLPAERSVFVLASVVMLALLMWLWRPLPITLWHLEHPIAQASMWLLFAAGWGLMGMATTWIDQADLLGLRQARCYYAGRVYRPVPFQIRAGYRFCRHPMMSGVILGVWATPHMTVGHAVLAAGLTAYILIGVHFEERETLRQFGEDYAAYRARVPMLIPLPGRSVPGEG
ncbi:MAG: isoprenylcysteine carboxylmethyltransferase family protein [Gammaproteobacteria bacterium]